MEYSYVHLEQEAILTGDSVALAHLGAVLRELNDPAHLAGRRAEPHPRRDRKTKSGRVDVEPDAADCSHLLEPTDPLTYCRRRNPKSTGKFRSRPLRIGGEQMEELARKFIGFGD